MIRAAAIAAILPALAGTLCADVPRKQPRTKYAKLWNDSPFTSKPVSDSVEEDNPFDDFVLGGVSPIAGGYRVTLLDKKKSDARTYIESDKPSDFKILEVSRKKGDPLGTTVRLSRGSQTGVVSFDEKLLVLKAAPQQQQQNPAQQGRNQPPARPPVAGTQGQPNPAPQRQPRPRIVPPPAVNTPAPANAPQTLPAPAVQPNAIDVNEPPANFRRRR